MTEKNEVQVIIDGKVLTMSGFESNEYLQKVANYINDMIVEYYKADSFKHAGKDIQHRLIEINIADELFKARDKVEKLTEELKIKENELYDMKHDVINKEMALGDLKEAKKKTEEQLQEAAKKIVALETQLKSKK
ncbi:MAG: cell division protein ZapA [Lachnospiraceae bacterium]|mgnify:FL=1|nr:cell division protein ZapA [Lachnospiraceae bacterium]